MTLCESARTEIGGMKVNANAKSVVAEAFLLLALAMFIISRYELTDEVIDKINQEIEARSHE